MRCAFPPYDALRGIDPRMTAGGAMVRRDANRDQASSSRAFSPRLEHATATFPAMPVSRMALLKPGRGAQSE
jgi:hypothetical protein